MNNKIVKSVLASAAFALLAVNPAHAAETEAVDKVERKVPAKAVKTSQKTLSLEGLALPLFITFSVSSL